MSINKWTKLNSHNFKYQLYYKDFETFSKTDKESNELVDLIGQYSTDGNLINKFRTISEAAEKTGSNSSHIGSCINGKKNYITHNGFVWKKLVKQYRIPKTNQEIEYELNKNIIKIHERDGDKYLHIQNKNGNTKKVRLHRFVYQIYNEGKISGCIECGKDPSVFCVFVTNHHDIDHNDGCHSNNDPENLQRMCPSCHSKKTNEQTRNSGKRKSCSDKKKVKVKVYKNGGKEIFRTFDSLEECTKEIGTNCQTVRRSIETKKYTLKLKDGNKYLFEEIIDEIEGEIWKDIPSELIKGQCSNKGRIKTGKKIITCGNFKSGYLLVGSKRVHIIIAITFLKDEHEKKALEIQKKFPHISIEEIKNSTGKSYSLMVDHIDRNPLNNCLDNLRWVSVQENNLNKKNNKEVEQWSLDGKKLINTFSSQKEASEKLKISSSEISTAIRGYRGKKQVKGFIFKFKDKENIDSIESVQSEEEKSYEIFIKHFEEFKKFIIENNRTPYQRKDELGIWYNSIKQHFKNKTACMSYSKIYDIWHEFVNNDENKKYLHDWNDKWSINFNKIQDFFNKKLTDEIEINKLKQWISKQNYNYKNKSRSMSDKNKKQYDKWTEMISSHKYKNYFK